MKKGIFIALVALILSSFVIPSAEASPVSPVRFFPCISEDGTYKLTIEIGYLFTVFANETIVTNGKIETNVRVRQNGGAWNYYAIWGEGLRLKYGNLPVGTRFEVELLNIYDLTGASAAGIILNPVYSITLAGSDYPPCFQKCDGNPLFKMFLLTRDDSYCILVSDVHPSIESQKTLCFPGTEWVATNTTCEGWVCDNGCWDCDYLGFGRLNYSDLFKIFERRTELSE